MRAALGYCCMPLIDVAWMIYAVTFWKLPVRLVRQGNSNVAFMMRTCHVRFLRTLANAYYHWKTLPRRCLHDMTDVTPVDADTQWLMRECFGLCCFTFVYVAYTMHAGHDWCRWFDAHTPWLMRVDLVYWILPFSIDAWQTRARHIQCAHTTGEVTQPMCTQQSWHLQSLADAECPSLTFLDTFHGRACRPWLMAHSIGRPLLQDKNIPWPCVQDLAEAKCHWPILLS